MDYEQIDHKQFTPGEKFHKGYNFEISVINSAVFANRHRYFCMIFLAQGSLILSSGSKHFSVIAPACVCLNDMEQYHVSDSSKIEGRTVVFHPGVINSHFSFENLRETNPDMPSTAISDRFFLHPFIKRDERNNGIIPIGPESDLIIKAKLDKLQSELAEQRDHWWPCRSRSYLFELLLFILPLFSEDPSGVDAVFPNDQMTSRIIRFINQNYREKMTVAELCDKFNTNRTTLAKLVKNTTGTTLVGYLHRVRMSMASVLLRDTTIPVEEIVYRVGFNDVAHFGRVFKKQMEMAPSEYRQKHSLAQLR
jgi:AraC-like DNA-binding protein